MKRKRMTQFEYLHVDRTDLFGTIKALQIKPRICNVLLSTLQAQAASHPWKNPANGKMLLQRLAKIWHPPPISPQCLLAPSIHSIMVPASISTPCSARALAGRGGRRAVLGQGNIPLTGRFPWSSCAKPCTGGSCGAMSSPRQ